MKRDIAKYEEEYNKPGFEAFQVHYRRKKVLDVVSHYPHKRILEIGCGSEPLFKYLADEFEHYVVVEPGKIFFDGARELAKGNDKIECINDYFSYSENLKNQKFDLIICSSLLHELANPRAMIDDIKAISNKNTVIHINVPNAFSFHRLLAKEMGMIQDVHELSDRSVVLQQNKTYDLESLRELVTDAGFVIVDSGSYFLKPFTHVQMNEMIESKIIDEEVLDGLYNMCEVLPELGSEIFVDVRVR